MGRIAIERARVKSGARSGRYGGSSSEEAIPAA
jgi:hypothetical protein